MKRLLTMLVILTGLIGSAGVVCADEKSDAVKGYEVGQGSTYAQKNLDLWTNALLEKKRLAEQGDVGGQ